MIDRFPTLRFTSALLILTLSLAACNTAVPSTPSNDHAATIAVQSLGGLSQQIDIDPPPTHPTLAPPTVTASTPTSGAIGLPSTGFKISVTFSNAMSTLATQHAFELIVPDLNPDAEQFTWNAAGTIMTMQYSAAVPQGTLVFWGMGAGAVDLAGRALTQANTVGGSFRVLREKTVKLYSDPEKDVWVNRDMAAKFGSYSARVGTEAIGGVEGTTDDGKAINTAHATVNRMLLQFSLNKLPDMTLIQHVKRATLHTTVIYTLGNHRAVDILLLQHVSTVKWFDAAALWAAPAVLPTEGNPPMDIASTSAPTADVTKFIDYDLKHVAQLFGLSQWRLQFLDEVVPQDIDPTSVSFVNAMNNALEFALGAYPVPSSKPYIEVTYDYP